MKKQAPQLPLLPAFNKFIAASSTGRRKTPSGKRISKGTIQNYCNAYRLLAAFQSGSGLPLRILLLHRCSLRVLQQEKNYWQRFYRRFSSFLYTQNGYCDNYTGNIFKSLKTFFNYLQNEKGLATGNYHRQFRTPLQQPLPVVLSPQQLNFLITCKTFEATLPPSLKRTKDILVTGCTIGLRVNDLMHLRKTNILYTAAGAALKTNIHKTNTETLIPLPPYVVDIIKKYKRKPGPYLLPQLSVTNLNLQLKQLAEKAGWIYPLPKYRSIGGYLKELKKEGGRTWRFHEHITAHTMRRTAITTLLILGVPEMVVRKISGHAPNSKEFYRYVSIAQDYMDATVKKAYEILLGQPLAATK